MNSGKYSGGQGPEFGVKQFKAEFWFPGSRIRKPELKSDSVINYNLIDSAVCIKEEWEDLFYWFPRDAMRNKWYKITKPQSGIKPASPALQGKFLTTGPPGMSLTGILECGQGFPLGPHFFSWATFVIPGVGIQGHHGQARVSGRPVRVTNDCEGDRIQKKELLTGTTSGRGVTRSAWLQPTHVGASPSVERLETTGLCRWAPNRGHFPKAGLVVRIAAHLLVSFSEDS